MQAYICILNKHYQLLLQRQYTLNQIYFLKLSQLQITDTETIKALTIKHNEDILKCTTKMDNIQQDLNRLNTLC